METLGCRIKKFRKDRNLTQEELAKQLYVTRQTISKWENNKTIPDIHMLNSLCKIYAVNMELLINGEQQLHPTSGTNQTSHLLKVLSLIFNLLILFVLLFTLIQRSFFQHTHGIATWIVIVFSLLLMLINILFIFFSTNTRQHIIIFLVPILLLFFLNKLI